MTQFEQIRGVSPWRLLAAGTAVLLVALVLSALALAGSKARATAEVCQGGAWQTEATNEGNSFSSESECVAYASTGRTVVTCTITGTRGDDVFGSIPLGAVACGFGGNDTVRSWVYGTFYGGNGDDVVDTSNTNGSESGGVAGTFIGGSGSDRTANVLEQGVFIGGPGNDSVSTNSSGLGSVAGTFLGGAGNDAAETVTPGGTFVGGQGNDSVTFLYGGTFLGGSGNDLVSDGGSLNGGIYNGGSGTDSLCLNGGLNSVVNVEIFQC